MFCSQKSIKRASSLKKIDLDEALKGSVFYITATSTDTKNKLNILIFIWFDSVGKKKFFNSNRREEFKIFYFENLMAGRQVVVGVWIVALTPRRISGRRAPPRSWKTALEEPQGRNHAQNSKRRIQTKKLAKKRR